MNSSLVFGSKPESYPITYRDMLNHIEIPSDENETRNRFVVNMKGSNNKYRSSFGGKRGRRYTRRSSESTVLPPINQNGGQQNVRNADMNLLYRYNQSFDPPPWRKSRDAKNKRQTPTSDVISKITINRLPMEGEKISTKFLKQTSYNDGTPSSKSLQAKKNYRNISRKPEKVVQQEAPKVPVTSTNNSKERFSIRRKIEQFRKWHEEQYAEKLKKLKREVDEQYEEEKRRSVDNYESPLADEIEVTNIVNNNLDIAHDQNNNVDTDLASESLNVRCKSQDTESEGDKRSSDRFSEMKKRVSTAKTWKTWRNINDSYAYKDVGKYIEDNELMTSEKEYWIREWLFNVKQARDTPPESEDSFPEGLKIF